MSRTSGTMEPNVSDDSGDRRLANNQSKIEGDSNVGWRTAVTLSACLIIITGTVLGNLLVCTAVAIVRRLRTPSNLLIVSLAVSDLLVASLVMTFAAAYEVTGRWSFGHAICDMWTSLDVMLCTASILNLCAISIDRYFVITRPLQYAAKRTPARMTLMIVAVWALSALISIPPLFGFWKVHPADGKCELSQEVGYQIYATVGAFYVPLALMIAMYCRIYMESSRLAMSDTRAMGIPAGGAGRASPVTRSLTESAGGKNTLCVPLTAPAASDSAKINIGKQQPENSVKKRKRTGNGSHVTSMTSGMTVCSRLRKLCHIKSQLNRISSSHERKATKTLGVIMGAFTACWLPFFALALVKLSCADPQTCIWQTPTLNSCLLWLGYANSFLNPIIYARFNRDFRTPFKEILMGRCRGINVRLRNERYAEQFGAAGMPPGVRSHRPSVDTVVRYNCSQGYTYVKVGSTEAPANFGTTTVLNHTSGVALENVKATTDSGADVQS